MAKKKTKKSLRKWHWFFLPFGLAIFAVIFVISYYRFDPELLTKISFYLDLANPSIRIARIEPGMRKEEIARTLAQKLNWDEQDQADFINPPFSLKEENAEGKYFPKTYLINKDANPTEVSNMMFTEFTKQINKVPKPAQKRIINQDKIIILASIIQREAAGKQDMPIISGILWNRLFGEKNIDLLQVDATLQYAKGNEEDGWWQKVVPADKKIDSPYNTYLYKGLPPSAIANPGIDAIYAAYNPAKTDCLFFLHDKLGGFHCTRTYAEHQANIAKYYPKSTTKKSK